MLPSCYDQYYSVEVVVVVTLLMLAAGPHQLGRWRMGILALCWGYIGIMEKMETGDEGMEKKIETTRVGHVGIAIRVVVAVLSRMEEVEAQIP